MTSIRSSHPAHSSRPASHSSPDRMPEADRRAMSEALASARRQIAGQRQPLDPRQAKMAKRDAAKAATQQPIRQDKALTQHRAEKNDGQEARRDELADPLLRDRERHEEQGHSDQGQGFGQQSVQLQVMALSLMPSPQVDPSGFAQMLADLWTRENGKGAKEVSVRFGKDAWPATGARLVRNAAGSLDVALFVANRENSLDNELSRLEGQLGDAGVAIGAIAIEPDPLQ